MGKTAVLSGLASTRPGHAAIPNRGSGGAPVPPHVITEWILSDDDPERPHPLTVVTPNIKLGDSDDAVLQRREQTHFDRQARTGGFMFAVFPANRWFSRQPIALNAPLRTAARYDVRSAGSLEDSTRFDLARETKQALAYAAISAALASDSEIGANDQEVLGGAMEDVVDLLVRPSGFQYRGVEPRSLEPYFSTAGGRRVTFDGLPTRARNLVAFGALSVRNLWGAYPGTNPRAAEGVVAIDEVDLHLDLALQETVIGLLRTALPRVQWLFTTSSPVVAGSVNGDEVLALRRPPDGEEIELHVGEMAVTH
ncbi:MAG: hypothetical protein GY946_16585 [bacterium]|nr:hypothetical protein [bacterium]